MVGQCRGIFEGNEMGSEKGLKLSNTEGGKEGKRKVIASWGYLEEVSEKCSKREGVGFATRVETS